MGTPRSRPKAQPPEWVDGSNADFQIDPLERLTCIRHRIHYTATPDTDGHDELAQIQIDNFLNTLAEVALAIARRKENLDR